VSFAQQAGLASRKSRKKQVERLNHLMPKGRQATLATKAMRLPHREMVHTKLVRIYVVQPVSTRVAKRRPAMKEIIVALLTLLICSGVAGADSVLRFKDGSTNVWDNIYVKGKEYCTKKTIGEFCVQKTDVQSVKEVAGGTEKAIYSAAVASTDKDNIMDDPFAELNCTVVDFKTYDEAKYRTTPGSITTNRQSYGGVSYGSSFVSGGEIREKKVTYMTVDIQNNSNVTRKISADDIKVHTIKGNDVSPKAGGTVRIGPGETIQLTGLVFPKGLSQVVSIQCICH
jgi:hypothetical protein